MRAAARILSVTLLFICQAVSQPLTAQSEDFIEGIVYDSFTSECIPFARIKVKLNNITIYSNEEGSFRIAKNPDFQSDSLIITCIGYNKSTIAFSNLRDKKTGKIFLTPSKNTAEKVKVSGGYEKLTSIAIIRRALGNLNSRYPKSIYNYISYYRDYQKSDSSYMNLNEAIVETVDSGFTKASQENTYRLLDFRKNPQFTQMNFISADLESDSAYVKYPDSLIPALVRRGQYGNELLKLMAYDPIRNFNRPTFSFIQKFSENFIDNHNFSPPSIVHYNITSLYKITFNGKSSIIGDSLLVTGSVFIQQDDYSIHKLEYSCYKVIRGNGLKKLFTFNTEYGRDDKPNSPMYLKYISVIRHFTVFDANDQSYFRLIQSYWDVYSNINPTLAIHFNNKVDPVTATQKDNYIVLLKGKEVNIKGIQVIGEDLYIRFNSSDLNGMTDSCKVFIKVLKDINGNPIDKRKRIEIDQYRELFVEEVNPADSKYHSQSEKLPAEKDTAYPLKWKERYWMNTPEKNTGLFRIQYQPDIKLSPYSLYCFSKISLRLNFFKKAFILVQYL